MKCAHEAERVVTRWKCRELRCGTLRTCARTRATPTRTRNTRQPARPCVRSHPSKAAPCSSAARARPRPVPIRSRGGLIGADPTYSRPSQCCKRRLAIVRVDRPQPSGSGSPRPGRGGLSARLARPLAPVRLAWSVPIALQPSSGPAAAAGAGAGARAGAGAGAAASPRDFRPFESSLAACVLLKHLTESETRPESVRRARARARRTPLG